MTRIDIIRRLLVALRCHLRRIRCARHAARAEPIALDVVLGAVGLASVDGEVFCRRLILSLFASGQCARCAHVPRDPRAAAAGTPPRRCD
ncbi:hypothetical protein [Bradyrhizobium sp. SZCCHNR1023]|uniref:hypothetical protein n=1 Tax=unclassified Bradyrhizobium TaxID=2631580 RepID=UPI002917057F|nr:hypothetical protein [Bradyrhizobium sp. SZCCHNR1023]